MFWMWITEFSTANLRLILGSKSGWGMSRRLSQLKLLLTHPKFLSSHQDWNFPGSDGSLDLLQSSLLRFTQCDTNVSTLLGTGAFSQVYRARDRRTNRRLALKVVIVDGVIDLKPRKQKEQERERRLIIQGDYDEWQKERVATRVVKTPPGTD